MSSWFRCCTRSSRSRKTVSRETVFRATIVVSALASASAQYGEHTAIWFALPDAGFPGFGPQGTATSAACAGQGSEYTLTLKTERDAVASSTTSTGRCSEITQVGTSTTAYMSITCVCKTPSSEGFVKDRTVPKDTDEWDDEFYDGIQPGIKKGCGNDWRYVEIRLWTGSDGTGRNAECTTDWANNRAVTDGSQHWVLYLTKDEWQLYVNGECVPDVTVKAWKGYQIEQSSGAKDDNQLPGFPKNMSMKAERAFDPNILRCGAKSPTVAPTSAPSPAPSTAEPTTSVGPTTAPTAPTAPPASTTRSPSLPGLSEGCVREACREDTAYTEGFDFDCCGLPKGNPINSDSTYCAEGYEYSVDWGNYQCRSWSSFHVGTCCVVSGTAPPERASTARFVPGLQSQPSSMDGADSGGGLSAGATVGIVVGGVGALAVLGCGVYLFAVKHPEQMPWHQANRPVENFSPSAEMGAVATTTGGKVPEPSRAQPAGNGWSKHVDPQTGAAYWYNAETGETQWDKSTQL